MAKKGMDLRGQIADLKEIIQVLMLRIEKLEKTVYNDKKQQS